VPVAAMRHVSDQLAIDGPAANAMPMPGVRTATLPNTQRGRCPGSSRAPVGALPAARPGRRAQARQAVADAARQYRHADGTIRFPPSENFYATGRNPG
jgi:hypothetical protein